MFGLLPKVPRRQPRELETLSVLQRVSTGVGVGTLDIYNVVHRFPLKETDFRLLTVFPFSLSKFHTLSERHDDVLSFTGNPWLS